MAFPALQTLSTVDVSKADPQWRCDPLDVETVLQSGEDLVYYVARTLYWMSK